MPKAFKIKRNTAASRARSCKWASLRSRTIDTLCEDVFETETALSTAQANLENARKQLQHKLKEIKFKEIEFAGRTRRYEKAKDELKEMATDIKTLYKINDPQQAATMELHTTLALDDVFVAENHIKKVRNELDTMSPIDKESAGHGIGNVLRCYDQVIIPKPTANPVPSSLIYEKKIRWCCLCLTGEACCVFDNCGHIAICVDCFRMQRHSLNGSCPICRTGFDGIFLPTPI